MINVTPLSHIEDPARNFESGAIHLYRLVPILGRIIYLACPLEIFVYKAPHSTDTTKLKHEPRAS